jgi:hypothetical protein
MADDHGPASDANRRQFLAQVGGAAATLAGIATTSLTPSAQEQGIWHDNDEAPALRRRAKEAFRIRVDAARFQSEKAVVHHLEDAPAQRQWRGRSVRVQRVGPRDGFGRTG